MKEVRPDIALREVKMPERVSLIVSVDEKGRSNIMVANWHMQTSFDPLLVAVSIGKTRYTHTLLSKIPEFVLAFPSKGMEKTVEFCGTRSGRSVDKIKELNLRVAPAKFIRPSLIPDCTANFECKIVEKVDTGDHTIFIGEVLAAHINEKKKKKLYSLREGYIAL